MNKYQHLIRTTLLIGGLAVINLASTAQGADCQCGLCLDDCACCTLKTEKVDETKTCWEIEYKQVCIPKVVFPWQKNCCNPCANNGACVRTVRVLKKKEYKCPTCKYSWMPKMIGGCGCCGGRACCDSDCCDGGNCDSGCLLGNSDVIPSPTPTTDSRIMQASAEETMIGSEVPTVHVERPVGLRTLQLKR